MTFCPEWLTGSPNLDTSNPLFLWVYLVVSCALSNYKHKSDNLVRKVHEHNVCTLYSI